MNETLGKLFMAMRKQHRFWMWFMFVWLILLLVANYFIRPHHPHIPVENEFALWAGFAFGGAVGMAFLIKKIIANLLAVPEDFYDDNK